jgi:hypothetical protein
MELSANALFLRVEIEIEFDNLFLSKNTKIREIKIKFKEFDK